MLKMKIFQIIIFLKICFSQIKVITSENELRSLSPKSADKVVKNEDIEDYKLLQTLYSDSYSNNYYYLTIQTTYLMQDKPRRLLSNINVPCQLTRRDALLVGRDKVHSHEPLSKRNLGILKDSANKDRELVLTALADISTIRTLVTVS